MSNAARSLSLPRECFYTPQIPPDYAAEIIVSSSWDVDHLFARAGLTEDQEWETRRLLAHARARLLDSEVVRVP